MKPQVTLQTAVPLQLLQKSSFASSKSKSLAIPILGLGTWKATGREAEQAVYHAIKVGYRHIDTAALYGNEVDVGAAIKKAMKEFNVAREDLFITTKIWNSDHADPRKALMSSLKRLGLSYVDLYLIHWPVPERVRTWNQFIKFQDEGLAMSIGVSNFTIRHLQELLRATSVKPAVNQVELSPFLAQEDLVDYCKKEGIVVVAYSPLTRGERLYDPVLQEIAKKHGKTPAQVALRSIIERGIVVIPKSTNEHRIEENAAIFDFELSDEDKKRIRALDSNSRMSWDPSKVP